MKAPSQDILLQNILDGVAQNGVYAVDALFLKNSLFRWHKTITAPAALHQWARDNGLRMEEEIFEERNGKETVTVRFTKA